MYTVKFMNDAEFDALPFKHVRDAMGCADPRTQTAYVRKTGIRPLDMFVTQHEVEELIAKVSPHEEDGIRYKKARQILSTVLPIALSFIPAFGPALGAVASGGMTGYEVSKGEKQPWQIPLNMGLTYGAGKLMQGSAGYQRGVELSKAAGGGWVGQSLSGASGAFGLPVGAAGKQVATMGGRAVTLGQTAAGAAPVASVGGSPVFASQVAQKGLQATPVVASPAIANIGPGVTAAKSGEAAGAAAGSAASKLMGAGGAMATSPVSTAGGVGGGVGAQIPKPNLWDKLLLGQGAGAGAGGTGSLMKSAAAGLAIPLVGGAFAPQAKSYQPLDSAFFQDLTQKVQAGAQVPLTGEQRTAITKNYDDQLIKAKEDLKRYYKGIRPGSDIVNDSDYREAVMEMERNYAEQKAAALTAAQLGLSQQQVENLSYLAGVDIQKLAYDAQISLEEAQQFKQMLADMGFAVGAAGMFGTSRGY